MRRRSSLAIMLVTVAILMSFSVVVATNTNVSSSIQAPESRDASHLNESEGEIYTVTVDGTNLRFSPDAVTLMEGDTIQFFWENQLLPHNAVNVAVFLIR